MPGLTRDLGSFASGLHIADVPEPVKRVARRGFIDCVGVLLAGCDDPAVDLVRQEYPDVGRTPSASIIGRPEKRFCEDAALVNGVAAHVLDYDDVTLDGHPSAVLVPAILAQGEMLGSSGAELLTAFVAGYEVWAELLAREPVPLHGKGWHPTAVRGTVAAAAAAASLRRLDAATSATALAIASSLSSGLVANFGSMTKSFHVGRAAQSGLLAARLAAAGMTASSDALQHASGFLAAFSPTGEAQRWREIERGERWHLAESGINIKRYPLCYGAHRAIDSALDLVISRDLKTDDIKTCHVLAGTDQYVMLRNTRPKTGLEAKFSMEFAMASVFVARKVGLAELSDAFVSRRDVQDQFEKVIREPVRERLRGTAFSPWDSVRLELTDGSVLEGEHVVEAKGSYARPLSDDELWSKFEDCTRAALRPDVQRRLFEALGSIDRIGSIADLTACFQ